MFLWRWGDDEKILDITIVCDLLQGHTDIQYVCGIEI